SFTAPSDHPDLHSFPTRRSSDLISGLFALQFLVDRGKLDKKYEQTMYTTYLASMFRSIRFGLNEAHGRGVAIQLNYFLDKGGVRSEEHTSELQSLRHLVCRLLLE